VHISRSGNILRFPRAAGEPPRANALRGLTDAFPPAGVYALSFGFSEFPISFVPSSSFLIMLSLLPLQLKRIMLEFRQHPLY
jgi:hypothetical protein